MEVDKETQEFLAAIERSKTHNLITGLPLICPSDVRVERMGKIITVRVRDHENRKLFSDADKAKAYAMDLIYGRVSEA